MAKMTKAQAKRLLLAIDSKTKKIWLDWPPSTRVIMGTKDMVAIEKIIQKNLKRLE